MPESLQGYDTATRITALAYWLRTLSAWIATAAFRGECHDDLLPCFRHLGQDPAVYWLRSCSEQRELQMLAEFFGGQDHQRRMLVRFLQNSSEGRDLIPCFESEPSLLRWCSMPSESEI